MNESIEKTMLVFRSDSPLNIQSTEIWSSQNIFKLETDLAFYPGVHSTLKTRVCMVGIYFYFGAIFKTCLNQAKYQGSP